jgi:hypothetical protein
MLQTAVILFACLVCLALLGLAFYAARRADMSIERRIQDAESGGHPLSRDEQAAVLARRLRPRDALPPGVADWPSRSESRHLWLLLGLAALAGLVVGQLIASAVDASGLGRNLIWSGAVGVVTWVVVMGIALYRHRQQRSKAE